MAREFKDYDVIFAANRAQTMINIEKSHGKIAAEDWVDKKSWAEFIPEWDCEGYVRQDINYAVYQAEDAEEWQKFRVGLKGLVTEAKLYCLAWYYGQQSTVLRHIRVHNYLGALVRGGQLNDKLEIIK